MVLCRGKRRNLLFYLCFLIFKTHPPQPPNKKGGESLKPGYYRFLLWLAFFPVPFSVLSFFFSSPKKWSEFGCKWRRGWWLKWAQLNLLKCMFSKNVKIISYCKNKTGVPSESIILVSNYLPTDYQLNWFEMIYYNCKNKEGPFRCLFMSVGGKEFYLYGWRGWGCLLLRKNIRARGWGPWGWVLIEVPIFINSRNLEQFLIPCLYHYAFLYYCFIAVVTKLLTSSPFEDEYEILKNGNLDKPNPHGPTTLLYCW